MQDLSALVKDLSPQKQKALAALLKKKGINLFDVVPISRSATSDRSALSYAQQRLWFLWQLEPDSAAYNLPVVLRLRGRLDVAALQHAFDVLASRHQTLRTVFVHDGDQPVQVIQSATHVALEIEDLTSRAAELEARVAAELARPFDLESGPLLRVKLLRQSGDAHVLVLVMHHIVSDGWSMQLMVEELVALYAGYRRGSSVELPALPIQYADYALWQRSWMEAGARDRQLAYWVRQLGGEQPVLELPLDRARPSSQSYRGAEVALPLGAALTAKLQQLAQREGATMFMVLLASFQALLHRYSGQSDIRVGVPVANRNRVETERLIGFFVNTQVLKAEVDGRLRFTDLLQQVKQVVLDAQAHQDLPFEQLVEALQPERSLSHSPLFQAMVNHQIDGQKRGAIELPDLSIEELAQGMRTAQFDLTLDIYESPDRINTLFTYATDLFEAATIERLAEHWRNLLGGVVADPLRSVGDLPLLGRAELRQQLVEWNATRVGYAEDCCIHTLIEEQAKKEPDGLAVLHGTAQLTYRELNERANRLAHKLIGLGVGQEVRVGIAVERGLDMLVGLLAILKAGGAYVPLDPEYPREHVAYVLKDSEVRLLLTQTALLNTLPATSEVRALCLDHPDSYGADTANPASRVGSENLAYVIYTSGSTGKPKGVAIAHRNTVALVAWSQGVYSREDLNGVLASTSICFDLSVWELFVTLACGGTVILARNALELPDLPCREHVRLINTVPSAIAALARSAAIPTSVRIINLAGEPLKQALVDALYAQGTVDRVYDLYGPSEDTTYSTFTLREPQGRADIGRPISNTATYLLDGEFQAVPVGAVAELHLGGAGIARGYLNRAGLTAERFVPDPYGGDGGRLYRTGDLARYRTDGVIEYVGRIDHQVKIRGFRIELGGIEARLQERDDVRDAVVVAHEGATGTQLVAYVVPSDAGQSFRDRLLAALKVVLPEYMVPAQLMVLPQLPLTPNGKLDRKALPAPDTRGAQKAYVEPETEAQRKIAAVWADVLKLERVGVTDNFFELGGDSIVSIQVVSRARQAGIRFTPKDLFQHQTVRDLAAVAVVGGAGFAIDQGPVAGDLKLLPVQRWFFQQEIPARHHWNQSVVLKPSRPLGTVELERALDALVEHHDALRLSFREDERGWTGDHRSVEECRGTLKPWAVEIKDASELERVGAEAQRSLQLERGPLLRAVLAKLEDGGQRLLLAIHHLVVDGVSWRVLLEDLQTAYRQVESGRAIELPAKTTAYKVWAEKLRAYAETPALQAERSYWETQLAGASDVLPLDRPEGGPESRHACTVYTKLAPELTKLLLWRAPSAYRTQINDLLLTALARVIGRWTGQASTLFQLEGHGREELFTDLDLSRTVGWFTTMYSVRLTPAAAISDSIKAVKEQLRSVPNKGIGFGVLSAFGDTATRESFEALPRPSIQFNYLGQFDSSFDGEQGLFTPSGDSAGPEQSLDAPLGTELSINGQVYGGELSLGWTFSGERFEEATIQRLADEYREELEALTAHCCETGNGGVTPSDFPLLKATQAELDALPVPAREIEDVYPLSPMQQGMLFHTLYDQEAGDYINQLRVDVEGLDVERFRSAWRSAVAAHEILRTSFLWQGELSQAVQVVHRHAEVPLSLHDWRGRAELGAALDGLAERERQHGFVLSQAPLLRLVLVRTNGRRHHLIYTSHHILMDGWSNSQLLGEVLSRYSGEPHVASVGRYRDYIGWLQRQDAAASESFWRAELAELEAPTRLAMALGGVRADEAGYGAHEQWLDASETRRLNEFARAQKVTVNTVVQAAWLLLLQRYTGQEVVAFGATVSGRPAELRGIEEQIGLFINTLPVVGKARPEQRADAWLQALQTKNVKLREHEHTPLYEIQRLAGQGGEALFDTLLVFENYPVSEALEKGPTGELRFEGTVNREQTNYPLTVSVGAGEMLTMRYDYSRAHFNEKQVERLAEHWRNLLNGIITEPRKRVSELPLLGTAELGQQLVAWNRTEILNPVERYVHQRIEAQAERRPDAPALRLGDEQLSYRELNERANCLAARLIALGVGPEIHVGVATERSLHTIIAFLATLKAGGAYVPLDPEYPADRLRYMLEDSGVALLLTQSFLLPKLPVPEDMTVLCLDRAESYDAAATNPGLRLHPENLAYVIYTSGSTGKPKGVTVAHGPLAMHIEALADCYATSESDCELQFMSFSFDGAHEHWLKAMTRGACMVLRGPELWTPEETYAAMHRHRATVTVLPPVYLLQLAQHAESAGNPPAMRIYCFGGDAVPDASFELAKRTLKPEHIINGYGPTETVVTPLLWKADRNMACGAAYAPIGKCVGDRSAYVLDRNLELLPAGLSGELYLGGYGVARGYHKRASLTAERFVPDPFGAPGGRLYRSGDLTRLRPDGVVDYVGRVDYQVKIRGFRIELGEIEARLQARDDVRDAVVVAHDAPGGKQLVGYVVPGDRALHDVGFRDRLRAALKAVLPDYMVPSQLLVLSELPLTPNGKLDRKALPKPDGSTLQRAYVAPRTDLQVKIAAIWEDALRLERVGLHENFFELGGDSIISIQVVSRARQKGIRFTPKDLFQNQTVEALAAVAEVGGASFAIDQGPVEGELVLLPIQRWFFEQDIPDRHHWNQAVVLKPRRSLQPARLERALQALVEHHDVLRLSFSPGEQAWTAVHRSIEESRALPKLWTAEVKDASELERLGAEAQRSLELERGVLVRAVLARLEDGSERLLLVLHHLVVDGVSWRVLLDDLQTAYRQVESGRSIELPAKTSAYKLWAEKLQAYAESSALRAELSYWESQLNGASEALPCDRPDGGLRNRHARTVYSRLTPERTTQLLKQAPAAYRTQINDLLLTALARVIGRWTTRASTLIQLEGHGREDLFEDVDLSRTLGWFTTIYPLRLTPSVAIGDSIKAVKEQLRAVPHKGIGFGVLKSFGDDATQRALRGWPVPKITFNYLGQFDESFDGEQGLFTPSGESAGAEQSLDAPLGTELSINGQVYGGELSLGWTFSGERFEDATIQRLADEYREELEALIAHCCEAGNGGVTPSDFPLLRATQAELDALPLSANEIEDIYPLSPMQQGMLFHTLYDEQAGDYINQLRVDVDGLEVERFLSAWQATVAAHDILRTSFLSQGEFSQLAQVVHRSVEVPFALHDWRARADVGAALDALAEGERRQGFVLSRAPLLRLVLVRLGEKRYHFIYTQHHIMMDGWSNSRLLGEVLARYSGKVQATSIVRYREYIGWLQRQDAAASESFWKAELSNMEAPTRLATALGAARSESDETGYGAHDQSLHVRETQRLNEFAREHRVTVNTVVQAAWLLLLERYTGQESVVFGATVSGRPSELQGIEEQIGLFINTLPVIVKVRPEQRLDEWLQALQAKNVKLREHEHTPLYEIQRWAGRAGEALFDSILMFENYPVSEALERGPAGQLRFENTMIREQTNYPLTVHISLGETLAMRYDYSRAHFSSEQIERFAEHWRNLLNEIIAEPHKRLGELPVFVAGVGVGRGYKALPRPDASGQQDAYIEPQTELERQLASIWADVLRRERVGRSDNFFDLGGDSILSVQVVNRARKAGIHFTPKDLFQHPTVHELSSVSLLERGTSARTRL